MYVTQVKKNNITNKYETDHPSDWKRSVNSMVREWKAHNLAYIVPTTRGSTKDVDFDLNSEDTVIRYDYQYKYKGGIY